LLYIKCGQKELWGNETAHKRGSSDPLNEKKEGLMNCALCGNEIKGRDYINASTPEKEIYVHSMPCNWYDLKREADNSA